MNKIKNKIKNILKDNQTIYNFVKIIWRIINLTYLIILFKYFSHKIKILNSLIFNKKINDDYFLVASTSKERAKDLKKLLNKQITIFKKLNRKEKFILIEVGVFLGHTTEELGVLLKKKLKNNFQIITIDPFIPYTNFPLFDFVIPNAYKYFIHNMRLCNLSDKIYHIKMRSSDAFKTLKKKNLNYDFCFIDGSHKYKDVLNDIKNFLKLKKKFLKYKGQLVGDDYEYSYNEILKNNKKIKEKELKRLKKKYMNYDSTIFFNGLYFHPGVTFALHDLGIKVKKSKNGIWSTNQYLK